MVDQVVLVVHNIISFIMIPRSSMETSATIEAFTSTAPICPADPRAKKSEKNNQSNWKYYNGTDWVEGDFDLIDNCHPKEHN